MDDKDFNNDRKLVFDITMIKRRMIKSIPEMIKEVDQTLN